MIGVLISTAMVLAGADATRPVLADQAARLVRQLDSAQLAARDEAERTLAELGPDVLPHLPTIGPRTSPEVARRLARIQQKLIRAQALAAAEPSLVTLKGEGLPLAKVLAEIARQTGNPISDHREAFGEETDEPTLSVRFEKTPFWRALDNVLDQAGLTLYGFAAERGASVVARPPGVAGRAAKAVYAGLFRLEAMRFEAVRDLLAEKNGSLKLFLEASWEPRLQPFSILQPLAQVSAVGGSGEALALASVEAEPEALIRRGASTVELEIPLALPPRSTQKIAVLKGKLVALVPGPLEDFRFRDVPVSARTTRSFRVEQRKAGTTVSIDALRSGGGAWELALRLKIEGPSTALESHRGWALQNEAYFEDAQGQRIDAVGVEQTLESRGELGFTYSFELKESPDKLEFVYRTPLMILELPVEYEFRNLALP